MAFEFKAWLSQKLAREQPEPPRYQAPAKAGPAAEPYHAVSIRPGENCCEAAKQFGQMRFLSAKAPRLPLPDCQAAQCTCRYAHYSDRRSGTDRRSGYDWNRARQFNDVNRRKNYGRRSTDPVG